MVDLTWTWLWSWLIIHETSYDHGRSYMKLAMTWPFIHETSYDMAIHTWNWLWSLPIIADHTWNWLWSYMKLAMIIHETGYDHTWNWLWSYVKLAMILPCHSWLLYDRFVRSWMNMKLLASDNLIRNILKILSKILLLGRVAGNVSIAPWLSENEILHFVYLFLLGRLVCVWYSMLNNVLLSSLLWGYPSSKYIFDCSAASSS